MRLTGRRTFISALAATAVAAAGLLVAPATATAAPVQLTARERGNDVSYPQCGAALPTGSDFGIVGVDGGKPFDPNPCLAEQIVWAGAFGRPAYYVNTANPGPKLSSYWPLGQRAPRHCTRSKPDSQACAFDYGWNSAKDSLRRAKAAAASVGAPDVTRSAWWLDVEMHNTWESLEYGERRKFLRNDTAVLRGHEDAAPAPRRPDRRRLQHRAPVAAHHRRGQPGPGSGLVRRRRHRAVGPQALPPVLVVHRRPGEAEPVPAQRLRRRLPLLAS